METTTMAYSCGIAASLGVLSHLLYFIRGEHHTQALRILQLSILLPVVSIIALVQFGHYSISLAVQTTACVALSYTGSLWTSMIIYRLFFHPLRHFPGPRLAKVSKVYHVLCCWKRDNHRVKAGWHERYGEFVRIGKLSGLLQVSPQILAFLARSMMHDIRSGLELAHLLYNIASRFYSRFYPHINPHIIIHSADSIRFRSELAHSSSVIRHSSFVRSDAD